MPLCPFLHTLVSKWSSTIKFDYNWRQNLCFMLVHSISFCYSFAYSGMLLGKIKTNMTNIESLREKILDVIKKNPSYVYKLPTELKALIFLLIIEHLFPWVISSPMRKHKENHLDTFITCPLFLHTYIFFVAFFLWLHWRMIRIFFFTNFNNGEVFKDNSWPIAM